MLLTTTVLTALLAATPAQSDSVVGVVRDADGKPLHDARVRLAELHREVRTDVEGRFRMRELAPGRYTLVVSLRGFAPVADPIQIPRAEAVEIRLMPSPFEVEPLTVTATRGPSTPLASVQSTTVLGGEALARNQSVAVATAIGALPGVRSVSTGLQIAKPVIRGLSGQRVLVLEDGHRLEDYSWSDEDGPSIDAGLVNRVEVVRGPASLQYGSDALGGVVNAVAEALPDATGQAAFRRGRASVSIASNNAEIGTALRYEGASGGLGWRLAGVGRRAASLHTPTGELDNTGFMAINGEGAIGIRGPRGELALRVARYGGEFKLLEANGPPPGTAAGQDAGPERKANDIRVQVDGNRAFGRWRVEARSQYQTHSLIEVSDEFPGGTPGQEGEAFNLALNTLSLDLTAEQVTARTRLLLGGSGSHQTNDTKGPIPLVPDATTNGGAGFAIGEVRLDRVTLSGGARFDTRHLSASTTPGVLATADSRSYTAGSFGLGIAYRPISLVSFTAHVGRAWRAPNLFELYADGPQIGDARYLQGDATLVPERSLAVEGGVKVRGDRVVAGINVYSNRINDYVYLTPTNQTQQQLPGYRYRQADARLTGFEAEVEVDVATPLTLHGQIDGVRATNLNTDEPLPLIPPIRTVVGAELHGHVGGRSAYLGADLERVERQSRLNPLDYAVGPHTLLDLEAGVAVHVGGHPIQLDLIARNLTNASYRDFLSRYKEFALNPGRDIRFRATTTF